MAEGTQIAGTRIATGTVADRVPPPAKVSTTAAYGYTAGLAVATVHYVAKCYHVDPETHIGYWYFFLPEDSLLEMWAFLLLPVGHLIAKIIMRHLHRLAGDKDEDS